MPPDPDQGAAAAGAGSGGDLMERAVDGAVRLAGAWKALSQERRMAVVAALVLWLTLFLPWYQDSVVSRARQTHNPVPISESLSGWAAFGVVQALVLLVALGIVGLMFLRAEGRVAHLPGGDGWAVTVAGGLSVFLVVMGIFNVPTPASHGQYALSSGLEWGVFVALVAAGVLTWTGARIRGSLAEDPFLAGNRREQPAPPSQAPPAPPPPATASSTPAPQADRPAAGSPSTAATQVAPRKKPRSPWRPAEQPGWTDSDKPVGWLTAPPEHQSQPPEPTEPGPSRPAGRPEQLTIRLEPGDE